MRELRCVAEPLGTSTWGPKPPYVAQLGPCVPQLGPSRPIFGDRSLVSRDVQEASRADFGAISDLSGRPWKPKNTVKYRVLVIFHVAPQTSSRSSKSAPGRSQNQPQERPGAAQDAPGEAQEASRQPHEPPRAPQERPQSRPQTASERPWRPSWAQPAQKSRPEASRRPFWPRRGPVLHPPGVDFRIVFLSRKAQQKLSCGQSLRKPTPSTALPPCVTSTSVLVRRRTADQ